MLTTVGGLCLLRCVVNKSRLIMQGDEVRRHGLWLLLQSVRQQATGNRDMAYGCCSELRCWLDAMAYGCCSEISRQQAYGWLDPNRQVLVIQQATAEWQVGPWPSVSQTTTAAPKSVKRHGLWLLLRNQQVSARQ